MHVETTKEKSGKQSRRGKASLARVSETILLKRARERDVQAFEELVGRTETSLYRLAMRYVHNESDAQEILQNAYLSAWQNLPTFEGRSQFGCWMYRITVNASLMCLRARNRHREVELSDVEGAAGNAAVSEAPRNASARVDWSHCPDKHFQSAELRRQIDLAVDSLPPKLKAIFFLRHVRELSTAESAGKLGVTVLAAKTRLFRARKVLRESLGNYVAC